MADKEDINKRFEDARRKLAKLKKAALPAGLLFLSTLAPKANAQEAPQRDNDTPDKISAIVNTPSSPAEKDNNSTYYWDGAELSADSQKVNHYIQEVKINSLDEIYNANRPAGQYIDGFGVVYTQYDMNNPTETEKQLLDNINKKNYSASVADHEKTHALMAGVHDLLYDGTLFTTVSDRIRAEIIAELICYKAGDKKSAQETIENFAKNHVDDYTRTYDSNMGSIVLALSAEEVVPETIYDVFERSGGWQDVSIDGTAYYRCSYVSKDGKYKTSVLHDDRDEPVISADILAKSPVEIGILYNADGSPVLSPDGQKVQTTYSSWAGAGDDHVLGGIPNTTGKVTGYSYDKAHKNYDEYLKKLEAVVVGNTSVTADDFAAFLTFANSLSLPDALEKSVEETKEIRDTYKDTTLEAEQAKMKERFGKMTKDHAAEYMEQYTNGTLKQVDDPSNVPQEANSKMTPEKASKVKKGLSKMFKTKGGSRE